MTASTDTYLPITTTRRTFVEMFLGELSPIEVCISNQNFEPGKDEPDICEDEVMQMHYGVDGDFSRNCLFCGRWSWHCYKQSCKKLYKEKKQFDRDMKRMIREKRAEQSRFRLRKIKRNKRNVQGA